MMARIVINDLKESVELDRAAMRRITGGSGRQHLSGVPLYHSSFFQRPTSFDHFNLGGFDFGPKRY
jgi:hypothetical protein